MSSQQYEDDYDDDDDDTDIDGDAQPERSSSEWAKLRRAEKARDKAVKELDALRRQNAFRDAGIDPNDPRLSYFVKGYEGEPTADAIKAEALKAGFLQPEVPVEPDDAPIGMADRIATAALGAPTATGSMTEAALNQAFAEGGQPAMLQYLASQGIPIADSQ